MLLGGAANGIDEQRPQCLKEKRITEFTWSSSSFGKKWANWGLFCGGDQLSDLVCICSKEKGSPAWLTETFCRRALQSHWWVLVLKSWQKSLIDQHSICVWVCCYYQCAGGRPVVRLTLFINIPQHWGTVGIFMQQVYSHWGNTSWKGRVKL